MAQRFTEQQKQEIIATYLKEKNQKRTAQICGCHYVSVCRIVNDAGLGCGRGSNQPGIKITDDQLREACKVMSRQEIAEKYGMHPESIARRMKKIGCYALKVRQDGHSVFGAINPKKRTPKPKAWHYSESTAKWVNEKQAGFEYIASKGRTVKIRCQFCGEEIEKEVSNLRRYKTTCRNCKQLAQGRKQLLGVLSRIIETQTPKTCVSCGALFYSQYPEQKYCSQTCKKKSSAGGARSRCRRYGVKFVPGITLAKVYERDKGICQICGKPTDWHDCSWTEFLGPMHPTIDHKKALANGGGHTWDNVQLAHAICNSYKRDVEVS